MKTTRLVPPPRRTALTYRNLPACSPTTSCTSAAEAFTCALAAGATSAGPTAVEVILETSGRSTVV